MAQTNLEVIISARDQFSGTANRVIGKLGQMQTAAGRVGRGMGQVAGGIARLGAVMAGVAAVGIGAAAREAFRFEDSIAGVAKTTDLTAGEIRALSLDLRKMATEIPLGVNELAALAEAAGALGVEGKDNIIEFARVTGLLGVTTNLSAEAAAEAIGHINAVIPLTAAEYEKLGATIVDLGNKGASTEAQIAAIAERASGGAATVGLATQELLGWSAAIANIGVEAEAGGTNFQKFLIEAAKNVAANGDELKIMAKTAGVTANVFRKEFGTNPSSALSQFVKGLAKLNTNQRLAVLSSLSWDDQRLARILLGLSANYDNLGDSLSNANTAWEEGTALQTEAEKRFATVQSKIQLLKSAVLEAALTFAGDPSDPKTLAGSIGVVAEKLKDALLDPANKKAIEDFGRDIGRAISNIDFDELIATARTFIAFVKNDIVPVLRTAFDAFNALPGPIKGIAASLAILSQTPVIGGAFKDILSGVGNIGAGVLGGIGGALGRTAVGAAFAQPVRVVNWPPGLGMGGPDIIAGGSKGLISKILSLLPAFFVGGLILTAAHQIGLELNKIFGVNADTPREGETIVELPGGVKLNYGGQQGRGPVPLEPRHLEENTEDLLTGVRKEGEDGRNKTRPLLADIRKAGEDGARHTVAAILGIPPPIVNALHNVTSERHREIETRDPKTPAERHREIETRIDQLPRVGLPRHHDIETALDQLVPVTAERFREIEYQNDLIVKELRKLPDTSTLDPTPNSAIVQSVRDQSPVNEATLRAIKAIQAPIVNTTVNVEVTSSGISKIVSTQQRYGPPTGSAYAAFQAAVGSGR